MALELQVDVTGALGKVTSLSEQMGALATNANAAADGLAKVSNSNPFKKILNELNPLAQEMKSLVGELGAVAKSLDQAKTKSSQLEGVVTQVKAALKDQTKELKDSNAAMAESVKTVEKLVSAEEKLSATEAKRQKIMRDTETVETRRARVLKELKAAFKGQEDSTLQINRALAVYNKQIEAAGTPAEIMVRNLQKQSDALGKTKVQLLATSEGWKLLTKDEKNHARGLQELLDSYGRIKSYITPVLSSHQQHSALLKDLNRAQEAGKLTSREYARGLAAINAQLHTNLAAEKAAAEQARQNSAAGRMENSLLKERQTLLQMIESPLQRNIQAQDTLNAIKKAGLVTDQQAAKISEKLAERMKAEASEAEKLLTKYRQMQSTLPKTVESQMRMVKGFEKLSTAEQKELIHLKQIEQDLKLVGKAYERGLTPMQKYERQLEAINRLAAQHKATGGRVGLAPGAVGAAQAGATKELLAQAFAAGQARKGLLGLAGGWNIANQATAAGRAALMGSGMSFGIFTSSTIAMAGATYALAKAMTSSLKVGMDFELQFKRTAVLMSNVNDLMNDNRAVIDRNSMVVKGEIIRLAKETQFTLLEVAEGANILARSGKDAAFIYSNLESVLDLAAVGFLDMGKAADIATAVMAGFNLTSGEFSNAVDIIAAAATKSKATVEQIGLTFQYIGPLASQAGINIETTVAAIGKLADVNIRGSKAGTGLRRMITNLLAPTKKASEAFDQLGIDLRSFTENGVLDLIGVMNALRENNATIEQFRDIFGQYALSQAVALSTATKEGVNSFQEFAEQLQNVSGYAAKVRAELRDTLALRYDELLATWQSIQEAAFSIFGPGLTDKVEELTDYLRENADAIAATIAGFADAVISVGDFVVRYGEAIAQVVLFVATLKTLSMVFSGLGAAFVVGRQLLATFLAGTLVTTEALKALGFSAAIASAKQTALATSTVAAATAMTRFKAGGALVLGLLGGPVGIAALLGTVAVSAYMMRDSFGAAKKEVVGLAQSLEIIEIAGGKLDNITSIPEALKQLSDSKLDILFKNIALNIDLIPNNLEAMNQELGTTEARIKEIDKRIEGLRKKPDLSQYDDLDRGPMLSFNPEAQINKLLAEKLELRKKERELVGDIEGLTERQKLEAEALAIVEAARYGRMSNALFEQVRLDKEVVAQKLSLADASNLYRDNLESIVSITRTLAGLMDQIRGAGAVSTSLFGFDLGKWAADIGDMATNLALTNPKAEQFVATFKSLTDLSTFEGFDTRDAAAAIAQVNAQLQQLNATGSFTSSIMSLIGGDVKAAIEKLQQAKGVLEGLTGNDFTGATPEPEKISDATKELVKYLEEYKNLKASTEGAAKALSDLDGWIVKVAAGNKDAAVALRETGLSAAEAEKALTVLSEQQVFELLQKTLEEVDPRFKDFEKTVKQVTGTSLDGDEALALMRSTLEALAAKAPDVIAKLGGIDKILGDLEESAIHTADGSKELVQQYEELVKQAANVRISLQGQGEGLETLIQKYAKATGVAESSVRQTIALVEAQRIFGEGLKKVIPEQQLMADAQEALNILVKDFGLTAAQAARLLKTYEASLPIGKLKEQAELARINLDLLGATAEQQFVMNAYLAEFGTVMGQANEEWVAAAKGAFAMTEELRKAEELHTAWASFTDGVLGAFADMLSGVDRSFGSLVDKIKQSFKQLLRDMILNALKNRIMFQYGFEGGGQAGGGGGFFSQLFNGVANLFGGGSASAGGGFSGLPSFLSGGGTRFTGRANPASSGPSLGSLLSLAGGGAGSGVQQAFSMVSSGTGIGTPYQAGQNVWQGFSQAAANPISGFKNLIFGGTGRALPGSQFFGSMNPVGAAGPLPPGQMGFAPSALGYGTAALAGAYAGYSRYQNTEGGVAGIAGGLTYGLGTTGASLGLMSMAGGGSFAAGVGSLGSVLGPLAWAAMIAILIDSLAGGKLFGTKYRPESVSQSIGIGQDGGIASATRTDVRQRSLFRGRKWRDVAMDATPEAIEAAERFWDQINGSMQRAARKLGVDTTKVIEATFTSITKFDKKGKIEGDPEEFGTLLGKRFDEDFEQFAQRVEGANILSVIASALSPEQIGGTVGNILNEGINNGLERVGGAGGAGGGGRGEILDGQLLPKIAAGIDSGKTVLEQAEHSWSDSFSRLMSIADRWSGTGEMFLDGANFLLHAAVDLVEGFGLLGADGTLEQIADIVEKFQGDGESLIDTYIRIKESVQVVEEGLANFGAMMGKTRAEFVDFSASLVESLGGLQNAQTMFSSIQQAFGSMAQFDSIAGQSALGRRQSLLGDLGLDPEMLAADFIGKFQEAMASGISGAEAADWVSAAFQFAQVENSLAQLRQRATGEAQSLVAELDIAVAQIEALGASEAELAEARALAQQIIQKEVDGLLNQLDLLANGDSVHPLIRQIDDLIEQTAALTTNEAELATARALGNQAIQNEINKVLESFAEELNPANSVVRSVEDRIDQMRQLGASEEQLARARAMGLKLIERELTNFMDGVYSSLEQFEGPNIQAFERINREMLESIRIATQLGATEAQLSAIRRLAAHQTAALINTLRESIMSSIELLRGTAAEVGSGIDSSSGQFVDNFEDISNAQNDLYEAELARYEMAQNAIRDITDYLNGLLVGDLSPGDWRSRLSESERQFNEMLERALAGDPDAIQQITQFSDQLLRMGSDVLGSGQAYGNLFNMVTGGLGQLRDYLQTIPDPGPRPDPGTGGSSGSGSSSFQQQTAPIVTTTSEAEKFQQALILAQQIGTLGLALDTDVFRLLDEFGMPLLELAGYMGINVAKLTEDSLENMTMLANALGVDIPTLLGELGIGITDITSVLGLSIDNLNQGIFDGFGAFMEFMGVGLLGAAEMIGVNFTEVLGNLGINLTDLNQQSIAQLFAIAEQIGLTPGQIVEELGISLADLATGLGFEFGELTNANWAILQDLSGILGRNVIDLGLALGTPLSAIKDAILVDLTSAFNALPDDLPTAIKDELDQLFVDLASATTPEGVATALSALNTFTQNSLPGDLGASITAALAAMGFTPEVIGGGNIDLGSVVNAIDAGTTATNALASTMLTADVNNVFKFDEAIGHLIVIQDTLIEIRDLMLPEAPPPPPPPPPPEEGDAVDPRVYENSPAGIISEMATEARASRKTLEEVAKNQATSAKNMVILIESLKEVNERQASEAKQAKDLLASIETKQANPRVQARKSKVK